MIIPHEDLLIGWGIAKCLVSRKMREFIPLSFSLDREVLFADMEFHIYNQLADRHTG